MPHKWFLAALGGGGGERLYRPLKSATATGDNQREEDEIVSWVSAMHEKLLRRNTLVRRNKIWVGMENKRGGERGKEEGRDKFFC